MMRQLMLDRLAKRSLSGLVAALGAPVGALYVKDGPVLVRAASHDRTHRLYERR
jgi:hypothetical protein